MLSVVVPFYNEERNASNVITGIASALDRSRISYEILAVDNGSKDRTGEIIDSLSGKNRKIRKVKVMKNLGYGWGVICGLRAAKGSIIGWMDGDGQVSPDKLVEVYNLAVKSEPGIYKIKRVVRQDGAMRKISSFLYNSMIFVLFGLDTKDVNACPKLFTRTLFRELDLKSKDWFIDTELMVKAKRKGYRIHEIPAEFLKREGGSSNVRISTITEFVKNTIRFYFGRI